MAVNVYAHGRPMWAGWVSTLVGIGITVGVRTIISIIQHQLTLLTGNGRRRVGKAHWQDKIPVHRCR
jgi:hypothetical protein